MGGGAELQSFQNPSLKGTGIGENLGQTGQDFLSSLLAKQNQGLSPELKALLEKSTSNTLDSTFTSGKRALTEATAGKQLPTGALTKGITDLYTNRARGLNEAKTNIELQDYTAKENNYAKALQGFLQLQQLAGNLAGQNNSNQLQLSGMKNNYNLNKYQVDEQNSFGWGDLFGGLFGAGGKILGGMASGGTGFFKP